ncbi:CDP-diacylglycerol--glycerol-3-phosphate 3-phosphatidyltransferase [Salsuginibacillus halophilus]|uniref:CDP-diacylglycerol--glycerol-3-phosphate 3-phosphatidyltransferase n=1 Tax=Salsuginibacillus halophilus TaxID=517424 RepID=A0A2P8HYL7_9BACI|nr:CDP-diacylglycerol--glycerol-3-phosphate 3-phosphatidyltransferase [Salsuginibacillus halophilus]PSL51254.1 CDP-diacylglycerol--glycerol-3-phosphate 3-phosphatidyltransferase [Salsuginibacillus halophilus]
MNLPNQITILRIALIPLILIVLLAPLDWGSWTVGSAEIPVHHGLAAFIFILAAATDWVDGYVARKQQLITNLGKFLDPLADKLLVTAALVALVELQMLPAWMAVVILSREFAVTGMRLVAAGDGAVIAASSLGKWKTMFQMAGLAVLMLHNAPFGEGGFPLADLLIWLAVIFTVISGWDYFSKNRHVFQSG